MDNKRPLEDKENIPEIPESNKRKRTDNFILVVGLLLTNRDAGRVIGKGGDNIKNIRSESGANVNIESNVPSSIERVAEVSGSVEEVTEAIKMIAVLISKEKPTVTLLVESRNLGPVIGKGGESITKIRSDTQANVNIGKDCVGNSSQKVIRISGEPGAVSKAIEIIVLHLAEGKSPVRLPYIPHAYGMLSQYDMMPPMLRDSGHRGMDNNEASYGGLQIETTITIPKNIVGKIIGRGGTNINTVRRNSGATIILASEDDEDTRKMTITGSRQSINMACVMIEALARR